MAIQWQPPKGKDEKQKKPKKELGAWMDILQMVGPLAASVVGTPLAGAAVSALLEGAESKLEGGSWKEALLKGGMSGGLGAVTGGLAPGADKVAGEATKQLGKGVVEEAGKKALSKGAQEGFKLGLAEPSRSVMGLGLEKTMAPELMDQLGKVAASTGASVTGAAVAGGGDAGAKQRFIEHMTDLGQMGLGAYQEAQAVGAGKRRANEAMNMQMQQAIQGAMGGQFQRPKSRFYRPYGSY